MSGNQHHSGLVSVSPIPPHLSRWQRHRRVILFTVWLGLLAVFGGTFWSEERSELANLGAVMAQIEPAYLIAALATVPLSLTLTVEIYHTLLQRLGVQNSRSAVWQAHLRSLVVGMSGPLGGPSAVVVFVKSLAARGVPTDDGLLLVVLSNATGYGSFMVLILPLLILLYVEHRLPSIDLIAVVGLLLIFALLLLALRRILRGAPLPTWLLCRLPGRVQAFAVRVRAHNLSLRDFLRPCAFGLMIDLVGALTLALSLAAIGQRPSLAAALFGTEIGTLFTVISPLFQGLGAVELSLTVVLEQFGIPSAAALSAALLYRACTLWSPFSVGLLAIGWQAVRWGIDRIRHPSGKKDER